MFYGKVIGGLIGLIAGNFFGLMLGVIVGHFFDRGLGVTFRFGSPENIQRIKTSFFETTFLLSGYVAKADGRVSEEEIQHTELIFSQMRLNPEQREQAIELFRQGAAASFEIEPVLSSFLEVCGQQRQLQQTLLMFLVSLAMADQQIDPGEKAALERIAVTIGFGAARLEQLLRMATAQGQFYSNGAYAAQPGTSIEDAYAAIGVDSSVSDRELKQAYRRRMSENHPDKLIAKGVPEHMVKVATERSQEIQAAYEMIKKTRPNMR
ncbi:MAG: co-chaperone DjlA [Pseudomonadota bacterium]